MEHATIQLTAVNGNIANNVRAILSGAVNVAQVRARTARMPHVLAYVGTGFSSWWKGTVHTFQVESSGDKPYKVHTTTIETEQNGAKVRILVGGCNCKDWVFRRGTHAGMCKHVQAAIDSMPRYSLA